MPITNSTANRQDYIDWLRIIAVLLLIPFHTARLFDIWETNYVKNAVLSPLLSYQNAFLWAWHMPLLFLLAGASTWYALNLRGSYGYLRERFQRLLVPLVFGMLIVVPPQAYIARLHHAGYSGSYLDFLSDYFIIRGDLTGYTGLFTPAHLWFILYLYVFSVVTLPLFLHESRGPRYIGWLARSCERPGVIFLWAVPLGFTGLLPSISDKNPFYYWVLFFYGYLLVADGTFHKVIERNRFLALVLGLLTMTVAMTLWALRMHFPEKSVQDVLFHSLRTFNTWFWLIALLGYGRKYLNRSNRLKRYANDAAYPFYILHQTVIMFVGYYVVQWDASVSIKYSFTMAASLALTVALYEICVKRISIMRFFFGMKPRDCDPKKVVH